jgi:hypothetical protein
MSNRVRATVVTLMPCCTVISSSRICAARWTLNPAAPVDREHGVPHGVHPSVNPMQPPCGHAMRDGSASHPHGFELPPRHDAVLLRRQARHLAIQRVLDEFCTYVVHFSSFAFHASRLAGKFVRVTPRS